MSAFQQVEIGALDAMVAALFGAGGYIIARAISKGDQRTRQDVDQDTKLALMEQRVVTLEREQSRTLAHRQAMSEELNTVAAVLDRHERWHERHDPH